MNILYLTEYPEGGTRAVSSETARWLRELGHVVTERFLNKSNDPVDGITNFDLVHCWNASCTRVPLPIPAVLTLHHVPAKAEYFYFGVLDRGRARRVHVLDPWMQRYLGRFGYPSTYIPQIFNYDRYAPLPLPIGGFAIGYLGGDPDQKRFSVIESIAREAGVDCYGNDSSAHWITNDEVALLFQQINVFVCASFDDGGPIPAQEALLYDRPVLSTRVGQMVSLIQPGYNGEFFDGSIVDGVAKLRLLRSRAGISPYAYTRPLMPHRLDVARQFETLYQGLLEEAR